MFNKEMDELTHCDYSIRYTRISEDTSVPFVTRKSCPSRKFKCRHNKSRHITNIDNGPCRDSGLPDYIKEYAHWGQNLKIKQFPVDVLEDSFAHVEHDSSLKYILSSLLHEENKKTWKSVSQCLHLFGFSPISPIMFEYLKGTISDSKTAHESMLQQNGLEVCWLPRGSFTLWGTKRSRWLEVIFFSKIGRADCRRKTMSVANHCRPKATLFRSAVRHRKASSIPTIVPLKNVEIQSVLSVL